MILLFIKYIYFNVIKKFKSNLKKNLIPVPNPFIKFKSHPIRDGAGRVSKKTRPVTIFKHSYSISQNLLVNAKRTYITEEP